VDLCATGRPRPGQRTPTHSLVEVIVKLKKPVTRRPRPLLQQTGGLVLGRTLGGNRRIHDCACFDPSGLFHDFGILPLLDLHVNPLLVWSDAEGSNLARTAYKTAPLQPAGLRRASYIPGPYMIASGEFIYWTSPGPQSR